MTEITYYEDEYRIKSSGHAEFGSRGQDIVCAALTALTAGAAHGLSADGIPCTFIADDDETRIEVTGRPKQGQEYDTRMILNAFVAALQALAEVYPYNAQITIHRGKEKK